MNNLIKKPIKLLRRLSRCLARKKGVYGKIGKGNRFTWNLRINETAIIGNFNYFGPGCLVNSATIGNYCSFAPNVIIGPGEHSLEFVTTSQMVSGPAIGFEMNRANTKIGSDVWVGANVVILQGVNIGSGAVIGAGAIVTEDIPPFAIAVGVPARVVRYRFDEKTIKEIETSGWYELGVKEAIAKTSDLYTKISISKCGAPNT